MSFLLLITPYVNWFEHRVNKFMRRLRDTSNKQKIEEKLIDLMQENTMILALWLEKKYKNYLHLKKRKRRKMYRNLERIEELFNEYAAKNLPKTANLERELAKLGLSIPKDKLKQVKYLKQIMLFLHPGKLHLY